MVFFVCGACGGSFKRKQAETHTFRCRNWSFSCMDCNKDFEGMTFTQHNKCITESEKNFGNFHVAKVGKDKNEIWMDKLRRNLEGNKEVSPFHQRIISKLLAYPNIPRKEDKFTNFLVSAVNITDRKVASNLWNVIKKAASADDNSTSDKENTTTVTPDVGSKEDEAQDKGNELEEASKSKKKKKKSKKNSVESNGVDESSLDVEVNGKRKIQDEEEKDEEDDEEQIEKVPLTKSQKKKKRKLLSSATDEPDPNSYVKSQMHDDQFTDEQVEIEAVSVGKKFKWRKTLKTILREGPVEGMKLTKLLNKLERLHNDPLTGAEQPLDKDLIQSIMMKNLSKSPFAVLNGRAKVGKFAVKN